MKTLLSGLGKLDGVEDKRLHTAFKEIQSAEALLGKIDFPDDDSAASVFSDLSHTSAKLKKLSGFLNKTSHIRKPLPTPQLDGSRSRKPLPTPPQHGPKQDVQLRYQIEQNLKALLEQVSKKIEQRLIDETDYLSLAVPASSMILKGMIPGQPLADQIAACEKEIAGIDAVLHSPHTTALPSTNNIMPGKSGALQGIPGKREQLAQVKLALLGLIDALKNYQSPMSVENTCMAKTLELRAAQKAIRGCK